MAEIDESLAGITLGELSPAVAQAQRGGPQVRAFLPRGPDRGA